MSEPIDWQDDGSTCGNPFSRRFDDRYRSEGGGILQAREVFLGGCSLPHAWRDKPQWCILETGFGLGLNFLVTWQAWCADPRRPRMLHFVSTEAFPAGAADTLRAASGHPGLLPFAEQLVAQLWGLVPGVHRLVFESGHVLLTLLVGDTKIMLRRQSLQADSVYLDGFSPERNPDMWDRHACEAVARCCKRGTKVATWTVARGVRDALTEVGFEVEKAPGVPPKRDRLQGQFNPDWILKRERVEPEQRPAPGRCIVIGAGLAGAAIASSLARRGWRVAVIDSAPAPAAGASSLPAGVFAPHVSPDDSVLSQISRSGVRATLLQANELLHGGIDWHGSGVLDRSLKAGRTRMPASWHAEDADAANDWTRPAGPRELRSCSLDPDNSALWHEKAGWIRPAALVHAWLDQPGIEFRGGVKASGFRHINGLWQVLDDSGQTIDVAERIVIAAGVASALLAQSAGATVHHNADVEADRAEGMHDVSATSKISKMSKGPLPLLALQAVHGQLTMGRYSAKHDDHLDLPSFPVNGHGSFVAGVPADVVPRDVSLQAVPDSLIWLTGATYVRDRADSDADAENDKYNLRRLQTLLPAVASQLDASPSAVAAWAGVRCVTPHHMPAVGSLAASIAAVGDMPLKHLWVCTGMGSRGLTFSALCGELLAAHWHAEPLPLDPRLARALLPKFR